MLHSAPRVEDRFLLVEINDCRRDPGCQAAARHHRGEELGPRRHVFRQPGWFRQQERACHVGYEKPARCSVVTAGYSIVRIRNMRELGICARDGVVVEAMIYEHARGQRRQKIEQIVVDEWCVDPVDAPQQAIGSQRDPAPRAVPENE